MPDSATSATVSDARVDAAAAAPPLAAAGAASTSKSGSGCGLRQPAVSKWRFQVAMLRKKPVHACLPCLFPCY